MTDEKTAFFQVKFQSTIQESSDQVAIVAQSSPKGFYKNIQKVTLKLHFSSRKQPLTNMLISNDP